jgi:hypothetical protein
MKTTPKTKTTKTTKPASPKEYIGVGEILKQHEDSFINIEEAINDHADSIENHADVLEEQRSSVDTIFINQTVLEDRINAIFWMCVIGIAVAITFAGVAIFRH